MSWWVLGGKNKNPEEGLHHAALLPYDHHSVPVGTGWQKQDPEVSLHHVAFPYPTTAWQQKQDPEVGLCHSAVLYPMPTIVSLCPSGYCVAKTWGGPLSHCSYLTTTIVFLCPSGYWVAKTGPWGGPSSHCSALPDNHHSVPVGTGWQKQECKVGLCHTTVLYPMTIMVSLVS